MLYQYIYLYINQFFKELQNLKVLEVPEVLKAPIDQNWFSKIEHLEVLEVPEFHKFSANKNRF